MNTRLQGKSEAESMLAEAIKREKIRRALLAGPSCITHDATVAEIDKEGTPTVLRAGTNDWVCVPGNENVSRSGRHQFQRPWVLVD